ncbi:carnitine O-palmitoyltransferase 1, muscle isoform-like [Branchiostoma floridae x Branchiostoma japonicum]
MSTVSKTVLDSPMVSTMVIGAAGAATGVVLARNFPGTFATFPPLWSISPAGNGAVCGLVVGCVGWNLRTLCRVLSLKVLLKYRGWMYSPRSRITKVWLYLVDKVMGKGPYSLFEFQSVLPPLPVPDLAATCTKYLDVARPLLSPEEYDRTEEALRLLQEKEGKPLQKYLIRRSWKNRSWLIEWWIENIYLKNREPLPENSNYYFLDGLELQASCQLSRAATIIYNLLKFRELVSSEKLQGVFFQTRVPMCMDGYRYLFGTCRIPCVEKDYLVTDHHTKHIVIIRKGCYFSMDVYTYDEGTLQQLSPAEIKEQLRIICEIADAQDSNGLANSLASITSQHRTVWAKQRQVMLESEQNAESLEIIETAITVMSLDTVSPQDLSEQAKLVMMGDGTNRWYDKSMTIVVFPNGKAGATVEHSFMDATIFSRAWEYVLSHEQYKNGQVPPEQCAWWRKLAPPKQLQWNLNGFAAALEGAKTHIQKTIQDIDLVVVGSDYGKGWIKQQRVSPDSFLQMALQLAYYRLHEETPKTYESATTRMFALGRTETIRSVSDHSVKWVKSMDREDVSPGDKVSLLKKAIQYQTDYKVAAVNGRGVDRHLLGLYLAAQDMGYPLPQFFNTKAWKMRDKLSTSQAPAKFTREWKLQTCTVGYGFGPSHMEGYSVSYMVIGEDLVNFHICTRKHCTATMSEKMGAAIKQAMTDMKALMEGK